MKYRYVSIANNYAPEESYSSRPIRCDTSVIIVAETFEHVEDAEAGLTECPTCAMQMDHGTGYEIRHPLAVLEAALVE